MNHFQEKSVSKDSFDGGKLKSYLNIIIGGYSYVALSYIRDNGVVKESCFPFIGMDTCIHKCEIPDEIIRIGGYLEIDGGKVKNANVVISSGGHLEITNGILQRGSGDEFTAEPGAIINVEYGGIE